MSILSFATKFVNNRIAVFPVKYRDKRPDFPLLPLGDDGRPTWEPYKTTIPSTIELHQWFATGQHNYGVVTGWNNLVVLDFDEAPEYTRWLAWMRSQGDHGARILSTALHVTTSRGVHVYVYTVHTERNRKVGKIDVKANGYVLGPGSIHPSGALYQVVQESWIFPLVFSLSEILPADMLVQATAHELKSKGVTLPAPQILSSDPWESASHPVQTPPGTSLVERVRRSVRIESFFPQRQATGAGRWFVTSCPFHDDIKPSFWLDVRDQLCGCFAGCTGKPMDAINLYARLNGLDNSQAIHALARVVQ